MHKIEAYQDLHLVLYIHMSHVPQVTLSTNDPQSAIADIQARGALQDPRCRPLLGLLDQLGLCRLVSWRGLGVWAASCPLLLSMCLSRRVGVWPEGIGKREARSPTAPPACPAGLGRAGTGQVGVPGLIASLSSAGCVIATLVMCEDSHPAPPGHVTGGG